MEGINDWQERAAVLSLDEAVLRIKRTGLYAERQDMGIRGGEKTTGRQFTIQRNELGWTTQVTQVPLEGTHESLMDAVGFALKHFV